MLKRVFAIDMQRCPNCVGGELKIIAAILQRPVIEKVLTHLGLHSRSPPRAGGWMTGSFAALNRGWRSSATGRLLAISSLGCSCSVAGRFVAPCVGASSAVSGRAAPRHIAAI